MRNELKPTAIIYLDATLEKRLDRLDLRLERMTKMVIDLWRRFPHPSITADLAKKLETRVEKLEELVRQLSLSVRSGLTPPEDKP